MEKPSFKRASMGAAVLGLLAGMAHINLMPPDHEGRRVHRHKPPAGKRYVDSSVYVPAGRGKNVQDSVVRNPKVAAQVNQMHEKWFGRFPANFMKLEPQESSLTSIKKKYGCTRYVARLIRDGKPLPKNPRKAQA